MRIVSFYIHIPRLNILSAFYYTFCVIIKRRNLYRFSKHCGSQKTTLMDAEDEIYELRLRERNHRLN